MATTKNATYKIYNGTDWDTIYFKTSAGQVGESNGSLNFLRPSTHTVNGKSFWRDSKHQGIILYANDILMSSDSNASTISGAINDLHALQDTISGQLDTMSQDYENRISALEGIVSGSEGGSLADTYQTIAAAQEQHETLYENIQIGINTTLADYAMTSAVESSVADAINTSKNYTDEKIAALVNGAPETLNTLDELAAALKDNAGIVDTLNAAIGNKANQSDFNALSSNFSEVQQDVGALKTEIVNKASSNHTHANVRQIFKGSTTPTGMASGDIWISY